MRSAHATPTPRHGRAAGPPPARATRAGTPSSPSDGRGTLGPGDTSGAELVAARRLARRARAELDEAARLRQRFLTAVSHELRTPLTAVRGIADTLADRGDRLPPDDRAQLVAGLGRSARRLEDLLLDLLDLERLGRGTLPLTWASVDLCDVVVEVLADLDHDTHALHVDAGRSAATVDRSVVVRIVRHLLSNALEHTLAGTTVRVVLRGDEAGALVVVEDDGPGMAPEVAEHACEPFTQAETAAARPSPGLGVGLALVRRLAAHQGGRVEVGRGRGGVGTRVLVDLPAGNRLHDTTATSPRRQHGAPRPPGTSRPGGPRD